jgi:hypothetical protein
MEKPIEYRAMAAVAREEASSSPFPHRSELHRRAAVRWEHLAKEAERAVAEVLIGPRGDWPL